MASSSVFRSTNRKTTIQALSEKISWYQLPKSGKSQDDTRSFRAFLALTIIRAMNKANELISPEDSMGYILTVTELIFPGTMDGLERDNAGTFKAVPLPVNMMAIRQHQAALDLWNEYNATVEAGLPWDEQDEGASAKSARPVPVDPGDYVIDLGFMDVILDPTLFEASMISVAGRWGVELFPIGKNVTALNIEGFRKNRINAVIRSLTVSPETVEFCDESLPQLDVLRGIERAFNQYKMVRLNLATKWARMTHDGTVTREADAFLTTFRMTDGFGLGSAAFIADLLAAYPILDEYPELAPAVKSYKGALEEFLRDAPELRGFVKVRFGSTYRLFAASSRGALIALAVAYRRQSEATAGRFIDTTPFSDTIARANDFLKEKGFAPIAGVGTAATATTENV